MAGSRDGNLRKGHLAEDVGVSVLRGFAAVSQVRHQDDIGVDAFAVLLQQESRMLLAGATIGVQFKAASVKKVVYKKPEIEWLKSLDIPFFLASVDYAKGEISFFTPSRWVQLAHKTLSEINFLFSSTEVSESDGQARVGLWPPIMTVSETASQTDKFAKDAYLLFSAWASYETKSIELRKYNIYRHPKWKTGGTPENFFYGSTTQINDRLKHMEMALPIINKLSFHLLGYAERRDKLIRAFLEIDEWYKAEGFKEGCVEKDILESSLATKTS